MNFGYIEEEVEYKKEIDIGTLKAGETKILKYYFDIAETQNNTISEFYLEINDGEKSYKSNVWKELIKDIDVSISMTSKILRGKDKEEIDEKYIRPGDIIEYTINVQNNVDSEPDNLDIDVALPLELSMKKASINEIEQSIYDNNLFSAILPLSANKTTKIIIEAAVNDFTVDVLDKNITTIATVNRGRKEIIRSEITHNIKIDEQDENSNYGSISGAVWNDSNFDGRRDEGEELLSGIKVKLLNAETNEYVKNENGETLEVTTNDDGYYSFNEIESGTYRVVFDIDTENYRITEYQVEGVGETENSDAFTIETDEYTIIATFELIINNNIFSNIDIGLIKLENTDPDNPDPDNPDPDNPDPDNPDPDNPDPDNPDPDNPDPDNPNPDKPDPDNPEINTGSITGIAWYDENLNGRRDTEEKLLNNIKIKLLNAQTNKFVTDEKGKVLEVTTNDKGIYLLDKIQNGKYIVVFEYDTSKYELTKYKVSGISDTENSDAIINELQVEDQKQSLAATDIIEITNNDNISNIDIGFIDLQKFDLQLDKYVSKIIIQNASGTRQIEYGNSNMAKAEIKSKYFNGSNAVIEYKINITNNGNIDGYVKKIADYMPQDLTFSSELNKDWYQVGKVLYTESLSNEKIKPGETKTITLTMTKKIADNKEISIVNMAEIVEDYNEMGRKDFNSTPGNRTENENDYSNATAIISIDTGGRIYIEIAAAIIVSLAIITTGIVMFTIIIKKKDINEKI